MMRSIILAAGSNTRLRSVTADPKCLLKVKGKTILQRHLEVLPNPTIVVGYKYKKIMEAAPGVPVIHNPVWEKSNTLLSLLFALSGNQEDTFLVNADVIYEPDLINRMVKTQFSVAAVKKLSRPTDEEVKVGLFGQFVKQIGKHVDSNLESVGVYILRRDMIELLIDTVPAINMNPYKIYYEDVLDKCMIRPMIATPTDKAMEIDTPEDYAQAVNVPWI